MKIFEIDSQANSQAPLDRARFRVWARRFLTSPRIRTWAVLKSLPVISHIIFAYFWVKDMIRGDYAGAAIDSVGLIFGTGVGLGLVIVQLTRSMYVAFYYGEDADPMLLEKDLVRDPEGTGQKLAEMGEELLELLREMAGVIRKEAPAKGVDFGSTAGGAAVGNPKIAAQGRRSGASQ